MSKLRWESLKWQGCCGNRMVHAEFGFYRADGLMSYHWLAKLFINNVGCMEYHYSHITTLKQELAPWLQGGELPDNKPQEDQS